jgi:hypothetical protein
MSNQSPLNVRQQSPFFSGQYETYFRGSDVAPYIEDNELNVYNGASKSRSWGRCQVTSTVKPLSDDVVMVNVTGWHKHTVSPVGGSHYFVNENGNWTKRTANHRVVKAALQ